MDVSLSACQPDLPDSWWQSVLLEAARRMRRREAVGTWSHDKRGLASFVLENSWSWTQGWKFRGKERTDKPCSVPRSWSSIAARRWLMPEGMALCLLMSQSGNVRLPGGPTSLAPCVDPMTPSHGLEAQSWAETKCTSFEDEKTKGA